MNNEEQPTEPLELPSDLVRSPGKEIVDPRQVGEGELSSSEYLSSEAPTSDLRLPKARRRRTGFIASLPNATREQINLMLRDGVSYQAIIDKLHAPGAPCLPCQLTKHHISEWKDGGYQDWLDDQFWQEEMRTRHGAFSGLLGGADKIQLPEGGLQLAAIGLCELLRDLSKATDAPKADPDKCVRLANSLARVSRSILQLQQYRDACARARAALQQLKDPNRKLTEKETRAIVRQVDSILGLQPMDEGEIVAPQDNGTTNDEPRITKAA